MRRREFIAGLGSAAAWPLARAQQPERMRRIGVLTYGAETLAGMRLMRKLLSDELRKLGWIEGRNLQVDFCFGDGDARKTSALAADLVQLAPDVIVTVYLVAFQAVQQRTKTIPIVIAGAGDILEFGEVSNPAHPEGNATGFANAFSSLGGKWVELLKEVAPNITRVAYITPGEGRPGAFYRRSIDTAARLLGVQVIAMPISDAASVKAAIEGFAAEPNGGLIPNPSIFAIVPPDELTRLAAQYRLPAIYGVPLPPGNRGLMSYTADSGELIRGAVTYVDRLLRGAKVSDLPVQYPTKFRLAVNLKTAKALGLTVPPSLLVAADEVIE